MTAESLSPAVARGFRATYDLITAESCEAGDHADCGYLDWLGDPVDNPWESHWDLQDLLRLKDSYWEGNGGRIPDWITCNAEQGEVCQCYRPWGFLAEGPEGQEVIGGSISIHRPDWITDASWLRVCRALGWRGRY